MSDIKLIKDIHAIMQDMHERCMELISEKRAKDEEIAELKEAICIHVREEGDYLCLEFVEDESDKQAISAFIAYWDEKDWS